MTNIPPSSSGGTPQTTYPTVVGISSIPRRSSYASVVSGVPISGSASSSLPPWSRSGANIINSAPSSSYPPPPFSSNNNNNGEGGSNSHTIDGRLLRFSSSGPEADMHINGGASNGLFNNSSNWRKPTQLPAYSRQFEKLIDYPDSFASAYGTGTSGSNQLFTPSYLKSSKYIAQLAAAHRAKLAAHKEALASSSAPAMAAPANSVAATGSSTPGNAISTGGGHPSNPPSLSTSSSSANLHRLAPSHRGMTYDIVENQHSLADDEGLTPLPSRWNEADKYQGLDLLADGLEVRYVGQAQKNEHEAAAVRANHPMPLRCGLYYFEVTILSEPKDGMIGVGFSNNKASLERLPGWEQESWAYHGDDGKSFFADNQSHGRTYGPKFSVNDTIGCGVIFSTGTAFFTKNGNHLGNAFRDLKPMKMYPSIGMKQQPGAHVRANFGQLPFVFDIDGFMENEKFTIQYSINTSDISNMHKKMNESEFIRQLVAQFLAHDGYVETARAFAHEVEQEKKALLRDEEATLGEYEPEDDADAVNRQKIRAAILDGDVDKALALTNTHYSSVLDDNPHIHFRLRCRKFIEMMRRCTESASPTLSTNQVPKRIRRSTSSRSAVQAVFANDMELDDQMEDAILEEENEIGDDDMYTEDGEDDDLRNGTSGAVTNNGEIKHVGPKDQELLHEAIVYGQQLQADYQGDERRDYKRTLDDIFSLVAYSNPKASVHGHLLDPSGRASVAEELNSAILVSLGKSSSAVVERLYQQTEVLVNEISEDGGVGAFINVAEDYLR